MTIRNVRNNNPGNVRLGSHWQGLMPRYHMQPIQEAESAFCVFETPVWGFRALAIVLRVYGHDGIENLTQAINRWAPPADHNDTGAYLADVERKTGIPAITTIDLEDQATISLIAKAITSHETAGALPYELSFDPYWKQTDLDQGVHLAFQDKPTV